MSTTFLLRRGTYADWFVKNPRLHEGEIGYELGSWRYKIGDGVQNWNDLPYFSNEAQTEAFVIAKVAQLAGTVSGVTQADLTTHVNSDNPHPVYDDGADLFLLYQNAKV